MQDRVFWDSNLWIYLAVQSTQPDDIAKQNTLNNLLLSPSVLVSSAQVFNEVANVLMKKKYKYSEADTQDFLAQIEQNTYCLPLTKNLTFDALNLKGLYQFSWYDSLIVAAAVKTNCKFLYSEDMHNGLVVGQTTIVNPFSI